MTHVLFHLAFPVSNILETKAFYATGLGCQIGRENAASLILNLYGHQLVAHVTHEPLKPQRGIYPRHFGLVFTSEADWSKLLDRAERNQLCFYQQSKRRFTDTPLEHRTFFLEDPFYNLLEFKVYAYPEAIFGEREFAQIGDAD
ncbi:MAG: glyoxalase [Leptolyngbyaceae cyanobacterium RU_5_1]|nr:glyoxalase [Leptolyngbyaceae cyanobacterium RU_5_1]